MAVKLNSSGGGSVTLDAASTASNVTQTIAGTDGTLAPIVAGTVWNYSSAVSSVTFENIPSWVKRITVMFSIVSTNGTAAVQVQLGTGATTYTTSGYVSATSTNGASVASTVGFITSGYNNASDNRYGSVVLTNITGNTWAMTGNLTNGNTCYASSGTVSLSGALTAVRIIGSNTGTPVDNFDAGSINILYE